jgi:hypothetical protein
LEPEVPLNDESRDLNDESRDGCGVHPSGIVSGVAVEHQGDRH